MSRSAPIGLGSLDEPPEYAPRRGLSLFWREATTMTARHGVDVGGTGIKAALVDLERGELVDDRQYVATPNPATPNAVALSVADIAERLRGCSSPTEPEGVEQWTDPPNSHRGWRKSVSGVFAVPKGPGSAHRTPPRRLAFYTISR